MTSKEGIPTPGAKYDSDDVIKAWLEKEDVYIFQRPVKKRFAPNPFTVTNVMDVWECDLLDVLAYSKYNYYCRYIVSVIDVFSKFLHMVPIKT